MTSPLLSNCLGTLSIQKYDNVGEFLTISWLNKHTGQTSQVKVDKKGNQCSAGMNITNMVTGCVLLVLVIFACCTLAWVWQKIKESKSDQQVKITRTKQESSSTLLNWTKGILNWKFLWWRKNKFFICILDLHINKYFAKLKCIRNMYFIQISPRYRVGGSFLLFPILIFNIKVGPSDYR